MRFAECIHHLKKSGGELCSYLKNGGIIKLRKSEGYCLDRMERMRMFEKQTKECFVKIANDIDKCRKGLLDMSDNVTTLDKFGYKIDKSEYTQKMVAIQKLLNELGDLNNNTYKDIFNR